MHLMRNANGLGVRHALGWGDTNDERLQERLCHSVARHHKGRRRPFTTASGRWLEGVARRRILWATGGRCDNGVQGRAHRFATRTERLLRVCATTRRRGGKHGICRDSKHHNNDCHRLESHTVQILYRLWRLGKRRSPELFRIFVPPANTAVSAALAGAKINGLRRTVQRLCRGQ